MKVQLHEAPEIIETYIRAKLVPFIKGSPGIGKSDIVRQIAQKFGLLVIDLRLAQCDPVDLNGFPMIDPKTGKGYYAPMSTFPLEGDAIPAGYNGWLLFLDELNSAPTSVQAAAYKVVLDRMVGQHHLHKNVAIVAAGNLDSDNAITNEMSSALKSRLVHLEVECNAEKWAEWASSCGFSERVVSFINSANHRLFTFDPKSSDDTYACPRTWAFVNRLVPLVPPNEMSVALYAGAIGEGVAREFIAHCALEAHVPKLQDILANPKLIRVPDDPSILWILCSTFSRAIKSSNVAAMMDFVIRMPLEFQVVMLRQANLKTQPELLKEASMIEWIKNNGNELF